MSRRINHTDWMWAQACDLLAQAEGMHRRFFRLTASPRAPVASWEPPIDVFEDDSEVVVVVAMPGVVTERVEITSEPGVLVVRAERQQPFSGQRYAVRQLEIPYGSFERRIALPEGRLEAASREMTHGCLIVRLLKVS